MAGPDSQLIADLYRRYGPAIHRRIRTLIHDEQEAFDLTQETFLAFMKAHGGLRGEASPFTVLYQIATFKAVDKLRHRSRWTGKLGPLEVEDEEGETRSLEEVAGGHAGDVPRAEAARDLALLTEGEEPRVLTAAMLYFVEGYTTEEVGQSLDLSRKTVGKLLSQFAERAKARSQRLEASAA
jgi:RNA polymerase sigma-70 factor (ECF subfamily)